MEPLKIVRSDRKSVSLSVTREGVVVIRAPYSAKEEDLLNFAESNQSWVQKRLEAISRVPKLDLSDGTTLTLFGQRYLIRTGRSNISGRFLSLPQQNRAAALTLLLKKLALAEMSAFTKTLAEHLGFSYQKVRISSARGRWGSCSRNGVISYTFRTAFLPTDLCEYVVVHELAHTVCFSHNAEFWEVVDSILPDRKKRCARLKNSSVMQYL